MRVEGVVDKASEAVDRRFHGSNKIPGKVYRTELPPLFSLSLSFLPTATHVYTHECDAEEKVCVSTLLLPLEHNRQKRKRRKIRFPGAKVRR
jgi:hypothetical protein